MNRDATMIFFKADYLEDMAKQVNRIIKENRSIDIMIDTIGILRDGCTIELSTGTDITEVYIPSGNMFISLSGVSNKMNNVLIKSLHAEKYRARIISKALVPSEDFLFENEDSEHLFSKRIKTRVLNDSHIAELRQALLGVVQDVEHDIEMVRMDVLATTYITEDGYMISLADDESFKELPHKTAPAFRISKSDYDINMIIPRKEYNYVCTECYIQENIEIWKAQLEALNSLFTRVAAILKSTDK